MLGYAFMGKAHSNAFRKVAYMTWPPPLVPRLVAIAGRNEQAVAAAAQRYGFERWTTDWRDVVADERDRPLRQRRAELAARRADDRRRRGGQARALREAARPDRGRGVRHLGARRRDRRQAPLRLQLPLRPGGASRARADRARASSASSGTSAAATSRTGETIRRSTRGASIPDEAGSGALGDLGTHVIDLARFLVGEIATVSGLVHTFVPGRQVDDALEVAVEFAGGAVGTIEATRLALGRRNAFQWEINGSEGSLYFDMERMNELQVFRDDGDRARGFRTVLVTEADHPFMEHWWPPGHIVGWGDTFVHEAHHLLQAIAERRRRRAVRRDVRGRLPRVGDRRRDRPLERERAARDGRVQDALIRSPAARP